jgi:hypothetical protein
MLHDQSKAGPYGVEPTERTASISERPYPDVASVALGPLKREADLIMEALCANTMGRATSAKRLGDEVDETRSGAIRDAWLAPMTLEEFLYLDLGNTRTGYSRSTPFA